MGALQVGAKSAFVWTGRRRLFWWAALLRDSKKLHHIRSRVPESGVLCIWAKIHW